MFCPRCGMENDNENLWCVRCGSKLEPLKVEFSAKEEYKAQADGDVITDGEENPKTENAEKVENQPVFYSQVKSAGEPQRIKDYFLWSILAAIFGSIIFGAVAIIFSGLTQTERKSGSKEKAQSYSDKAKLFCIIATGIGIAKALFVIVLMVIFFVIALLPFYFY